jgi:type VI secretion system secreted protein VgrG
VGVFGAASLDPGKLAKRDLTFSYHDEQPVEGAEFRIEYADGKAFAGVFDKRGRADLTAAPVGNGRIRLGKGTRPFEVKATECSAAYPAYEREWHDYDYSESRSKGMSGGFK